MTSHPTWTRGKNAEAALGASLAALDREATTGVISMRTWRMLLADVEENTAASCALGCAPGGGQFVTSAGQLYRADPDRIPSADDSGLIVYRYIRKRCTWSNNTRLLPLSAINGLSSAPHATPVERC